MDEIVFYGPEQAGIHHEAFGRLAGRAANLLRSTLETAGFDAEIRDGYEPGESMAGWVVVLARRR